MSSITFINVPSHPTAVFSAYPPIGVLSMSSCLKACGHTTEFVDADIERLTPDQLLFRVRKTSPDLIGISLTVSQVMHAVPYIRMLRKYLPETPIVAGGPYVSAVDQRIFDDFPELDYAVVQEGEEAIVELLESINGQRPESDVTNLIYRQDHQLHCNPVRRIQDLDALPLPDYALIAPQIAKYCPPPPQIARPSVAIMCTRGCPYRCTFCSSPKTWRRKVTFRSPESVIDEVFCLKRTLGVKEVFFVDDTLNARPSWFLELCKRLIQCGLNRDTYFRCPFRVNQKLVTKEILEAAKEANFWMIFYGVESGSQEMLDRINKDVTVAEIERAFRLTREVGLQSFASMMVGNYGETHATVTESIELLKRIRPDFGGFAIAAPFPGTELHEICRKKNLLLEDDFKKYQFGECILRTDELSREDICALTEQANRTFPYYLSMDRLDPAEARVRLSDWIPPTDMDARQTQYVPVKVHNVSTTHLISRLPFPVYLSYHWMRSDGSFEVWDGERTPIEVPLQSRENRWLYARVTAPSRPGTYSLQITLVQEGNFWFGDLFVDPDSLDERDSSEVKAKMSVECSVEVIRLPVSEDQYGRTEEQ